MNTNEIIDRKWTKLSYPSYWMYNFLFGLKVIAECGKVKDPRCEDALQLLESKQLPEGGFPAEQKNFVRNKTSRYSPVDWGETNRRKMNEWITIDALYILKEADKIDIEVLIANYESEKIWVDFYINNVFKSSKLEHPFLWNWNDTVFGLHKIKIIAYDDFGNKDIGYITVFKFL